MHVLNVVTSGTSPFFEQQVRTLERMGVTCTTVSISDRRDMDDETVERRSVGSWVRFYARIAARLTEPYDLVHANYGLTAPIPVLQPRFPSVVSLWGSDLMGTIGPLSKACARHADEVIVMSEGMAAELDGPCHVIPHGVDTDRFRPLPREGACREVGWDPGRKHVLFPYAAARSVKNYPRAERVFEAARERVDGRVRLQTVSGVDHERMPLYYNAADAMLMTSDSEGSPNTPKEALACNLPVVSTDVGDVHDQLDGVSPSAVCTSDAELVDALVSTLRTGERSNGREKAKRAFSAERMGERLLDVYERTIRRHG